MKIKSAQVKSQGDSSFLTDGHKAILTKLNCKLSLRQSERGRVLTTIINHNISITLERSVINYWGGGGEGEGGLKPVLRCSKLTLGSAVVHIHIEVVRSA